MENNGFKAPIDYQIYPIDYQIYEEGILETQKFFKCDRERAIEISNQIARNIENYLKTEYDKK